MEITPSELCVIEYNHYNKGYSEGRRSQQVNIDNLNQEIYDLQNSFDLQKKTIDELSGLVNDLKQSQLYNGQDAKSLYEAGIEFHTKLIHQIEEVDRWKKLYTDLENQFLESGERD